MCSENGTRNYTTVLLTLEEKTSQRIQDEDCSEFESDDEIVGNQEHYNRKETKNHGTDDEKETNG